MELKAQLDCIKRCKTKAHVDTEINLFRARNLDKYPAVVEYLDRVFFTAKWRYSWTDIHRENLRGLFNTNNYLESFFKKMLQVVLQNKGHYRICVVMVRIFNTLMPHYIYQSEYKQKGNPCDVVISYTTLGLIPLRETPADLEERKILRKGRQIYNDHIARTFSKALITNDRKSDFYTVSSCSKNRPNVIWNIVYSETLQKFACSCPWHKHFGKTCKHLVAVSLFYKGILYLAQTATNILLVANNIDISKIYFEGSKRLLKAASELSTSLTTTTNGYLTTGEQRPPANTLRIVPTISSIPAITVVPTVPSTVDPSSDVISSNIQYPMELALITSQIDTTHEDPKIQEAITATKELYQRFRDQQLLLQSLLNPEIDSIPSFALQVIEEAPSSPPAATQPLKYPHRLQFNKKGRPGRKKIDKLTGFPKTKQKEDAYESPDELIPSVQQKRKRKNAKSTPSCKKIKVRAAHNMEYIAN